GLRGHSRQGSSIGLSPQREAPTDLTEPLVGSQEPTLANARPPVDLLHSLARQGGPFTLQYASPCRGCKAASHERALLQAPRRPARIERSRPRQLHQATDLADCENAGCCRVTRRTVRRPCGCFLLLLEVRSPVAHVSQWKRRPLQWRLAPSPQSRHRMPVSA